MMSRDAPSGKVRAGLVRTCVERDKSYTYRRRTDIATPTAARQPGLSSHFDGVQHQSPAEQRIMAEKAQSMEETPKAEGGAPTPPKRGLGHRGADPRDTAA